MGMVFYTLSPAPEWVKTYWFLNGGLIATLSELCFAQPLLAELKNVSPTASSIFNL